MAASKSLMGARTAEIIANKSSRYPGRTLIVLTSQATTMEKLIVMQ